jgi:hypothetical protein
MSRTGLSSALAGLAALAVVASAVVPCQCLAEMATCHNEVREASAHACCETPIGMQAVADACCDSDSGPVLVTADVFEVAPPAPQSGVTVSALPGPRSAPVTVPGTLPPPALGRTTVLLI